MTSQTARPTSRRAFRKASSAPTVPLFIPAAALSKQAPRNRINVAFIGTGNQGMNLIRQFLTANLGRIIAVCDVNRASYGYSQEDHFYGRDPAKQLVDEHYGSSAARGCGVYTDFREGLSRSDVDAVFLVVPDHLHKLMVVMAATAGKDIYCEKPLTLTVADSREMVEVVRSNDIIMQVGSHERSNPRSKFICEKALCGEIGEIKRVVTNVGYNNKIGPGPGWKTQPVPEGSDYDMWLGPAPEVP